MAIYEERDTPARIEIDLSGPEGNVFYLLGMAKKLGKKIGFSKNEIDEVINEMTSGDYENAIQTFDDAFGDFVDLYR